MGNQRVKRSRTSDRRDTNLLRNGSMLLLVGSSLGYDWYVSVRITADSVVYHVGPHVIPGSLVVLIVPEHEP